MIDGARAEGQVNAAIQSAWTPDGLKLLEDAIQREYGVALKINFTPVQNYIQRFAELSSELAADTTPSFDLQPDLRRQRADDAATRTCWSR